MTAYMAGEQSQLPVPPEREVEERAGLFNMEEMFDDEITELGCALDDAYWAGWPDSTPNPAYDALIGSFRLSVRSLARTQPQRARSLIERWTQAPNAAQREHAAYTVEAFLEEDYSFVRDTLIFIENDSTRFERSDVCGEQAFLKLRALAKGFTPEQRADTQVHLEAIGAPSL